jgi:hypothetical protein
MSGWIKLHRKLNEHWIWQDPIKLKWWITMLFEMNHSKNKVNIGNQLFEVNSGQSIKSLQTWGIIFGTSKDAVRNFFKLLEKDGMIKIENLQKTTRITICNYESYQTSLHDSQTQTKRKPNATPTLSHPNNNDKEGINNDKEGKEDKEIPEFSEFFDFAKSLKEVYTPELDFSLKAKYDSWVENKWKDGNNEKIKNWKTKLRNTIPYLKKVYKDKNDSGLSLAHTKAF